MKTSSNKIRLGKTGDSRTRGKQKEPEAQGNLPEKYRQHQDFYNYLLAKGDSRLSSQGHMHRVHHFLDWAKGENLTVDSIRSADILHYLQSFKKEVKQKTKSIQVNSIRHYFDYLKQTEQVAKNPASRIEIKGIKRRTLYHILTRQELDGLYEQFKIPEETDPHNHPYWQRLGILSARRDKVITGLFVFQGLSSEELLRLDEKDIKLREGKVYVAGGRRSNERELKLEAHQVLDLMEYSLKTRPELLERTGKSSEKFFISTGESESLHNTISSLMKKLSGQNPKASSLKQIRASVITHWLKIYNLREVQYRAGHRYVSSTEAYQINDLEDLSEQIMKYHPIG